MNILHLETSPKKLSNSILNKQEMQQQKPKQEKRSLILICFLKNLNYNSLFLFDWNQNLNNNTSEEDINYFTGSVLSIYFSSGHLEIMKNALI